MNENTDKADRQFVAIGIKPEELDRIRDLIAAIYLAREHQKPKSSLCEFWLALTTLQLVATGDMRRSFEEEKDRHKPEYNFDTLMRALHAAAQAFVDMHMGGHDRDQSVTALAKMTPDQVAVLIDLLRADPTDLHQA